MNLSLQVTDFDGEERFDIVLGDIVRGEAAFWVALNEGGVEEGEKGSRRSEVSDIPAGRFMPLFLL